MKNIRDIGTVKPVQPLKPAGRERGRKSERGEQRQKTPDEGENRKQQVVPHIDDYA